MIGRTIQHYQIVETLGRGGMGVVYKARDTHLDRFVAIKVLPPEKVADPDRKRRFVQEAKAASALNHPNIVHIYDIAEADGMQFIAMEYVPGKTLDQLIGRKGLRLNETLKYTVQIADALAKAHSAGIVHRDLKPSNVMVTADGLVKVLDFGLAKLTERTSGEFGETATMQEDEKPETEEGTVVGTVAYMSPEQAEGRPVDSRSDLFAFGSLLYEMVTGQRAFHGDSKLSTLSAILKEDPKPVSTVVADAPRDLEKIITRCLRKDPARRFQHTDDLKIALAELKEESDSGTAVGAQTGAHPGRRTARLTWMSGAFAAVVLGVLGFWLWRPAQTPRPVPKVVPLTSYPGLEISPSFSPDGNQVAFAWDGSENAPNDSKFHIYLKLIGGSEPVRLTHDAAQEFSPAWSPDGRYVAFLRTLSADRAGVFLVPAIGGQERKIAETYLDPSLDLCVLLAWFPDGKWLVIADKASPGEPYALFLLSVESGEKTRLTSPPQKSLGDISAAVSPDGRAVVFARFIEKDGIGDVFLLQIAESLTPKGEPSRLTFENCYSDSPVWTPDGRTIVFSSGPYHTPSLWEIPPSRPRGRAAKPERLAFAGDGVKQPAISRRGQLAYVQIGLDVDIWRLELNGGRPTEKPATDLISSTRIDHAPTYSPDGKRIAFASNRSGSFEIWVCNSDGSSPVQLTSFASPYDMGDPRWSPDGRFIYFGYSPGGKPGIYVIGSEGGSPKHLEVEVLEGWSRDGKWMYFSKRSGEKQIWKMPANGGEAVQVTRKGEVDEMKSPDGRYLYYKKGSKNGLWKLPLGGGEETQVLESVLNNNHAVVDRGIYFIPDSKPFSVQFLSFDTGKIVTIAKIPREPDWGFSVSPDGRSLLYSELEAIRADLMLVENFR